jgi:glycosyltransferase involved in cell wall biosynthesis
MGIEVILHPSLSVVTRPMFKSWKLLQFLANFPYSVWFLWRLIRKRKIDLVHTNTGVMISAALAAKLAGVPHVWHIRDWFQEFRRYWPVYSWYIQNLSEKVVAVSNAVAHQFEPPAIVIHDGFTLKEFRVPKESLGREFRARYGLGNGFVVGVVGRIKYVRKGQEVLVEAASILKKRGKPIKALIVGAPFPGNESHLTELQGLIRRLGVEDCVVLTGELPDTRPAYAAMNLMALTSAQPEPFGGVVMEAMAMQVPVIATNIGGSVDQVVEGVTGLLVPPGEPVALADSIEKLMKDPELCLRMGAASSIRIEKNFTLEEMTTKMEDLFEGVIEQAQA